MDPSSVLAKTQKGTDEIATRQHKLDARLRALLIMVNGKASAAELGAKFGGDVGAMLVQLAAQGFVQEAGAAAPTAASGPAAPRPAAASSRAGGTGDFKQVQREIVGLLNAALGPEADSISLKIEGCKSPAELRAFLEARRAILDQLLKAKAAQLWAKAETLPR
jgi:hypothetical protein